MREVIERGESPEATMKNLDKAIDARNRLWNEWAQKAGELYKRQARRAWGLGRPKELTVERQPIIAQDAIEWEI